MLKFDPITQESHGHLCWKPNTRYAFAAQDVLVPLVAQELHRAVLHLPIAFAQCPAHTPENAPGGTPEPEAPSATLMPVAVLGVPPGRNLLVAADGRWLGEYTPAAYRAYPFALSRLPSGQQTLAFDAGSGLLSTSPTEGAAFYDPDGKPSAALQHTMRFLAQVQNNQRLTARLCQLLLQHQLLQPWPIVVRTAQGERTLQGLHRVDEVALNALPAEPLHTLQQAGALTVAYCQLLSMQHLPQLGKRAAGQPPAAAPSATLPATAAPGDLMNVDFLSQSGTLQFGGQ